ncbi:MAG: tetratricopeptide repeat protein [Holophaga sp.]|nr:tetratricopeptide repeat protein [Holophaga sp.]
MPSFAPGMRCFPLVLALVPALVAQDADLPERLFRSGERAYAAHAYPEALETWNQLIQQAPRSPFAAQALLDLARHKVDVDQQPQEALPLLERIKNEHLKTPWAAEAMLLRGQLLAARSHGPTDIKEAQAEFNRVVDLFPDHPCVQQARFELGRSYHLLGQWGRALQSHLEAVRLDPATPVAREAQLAAAETLDLMGDTPGCLRMLQALRNRFPESPQSREAAWRIQVRVKQRLQKPALRSLGPWPDGRVKWLKTPTLLATGPGGELFIYQDDQDQAFLLQNGQLTPAGPPAKNARAMVAAGPGQVWLVTRMGVVKDAAPAPGAAGFPSPSGAARDGWGNLWVCDSKLPAIQVFPPEGPPRSIPVGAVALAALPTGGVAAASDSSRSLLFLDPEGGTRITVPYGKGLPAPFKYVVALASDPVGHVAALVDGDFEGVAVWGPDGALLRSASYKALGLAGKFRAIAMDRQGSLILADRSNDLLIRLD